jgi:type IV pilus assembly protein PilA
MFLQNLRTRIAGRLSGDREAGFTLIELLVVMLILGILAAIALPAFFNQKEKAGDAKAKETAHSAQVAVETYATENGGSYEGVTLPKLHKIEPTIEEGAGSPVAVVAIEAGKGYEITVTSTSTSGNKFQIVNKSGTLTYPCSTPETGGCPVGGWGKG